MATSVVPRRVIIDTDGGVDDAAALWWALTDPRLDLVGVTTVGGVVPAAEAAGNVLRILDAAGRRDIPVAVGADDRVGPAPPLRRADFIHGDDGLGNTRRPIPDGLLPASASAGDLLLRLVAETPGRTSIVSLGPLTNLAQTIAHDPTWAGRVQELVAMAGSARSGGNALPAGEANVAHDPTAAMRVVEAGWAQPPLMVGLDVTHRATLTDAEFALLAQHRTPAAAFLDAPLRFYRPYGSTFTTPHCPCHDLFAVLALAEPGLVLDAPVLPLAVDTGMGAAWGSTVADFRAIVFARTAGSEQERPMGFHPWRIALDADVPAFRAAVRRLFGDRGGPREDLEDEDATDR